MAYKRKFSKKVYRTTRYRGKSARRTKKIFQKRVRKAVLKTSETKTRLFASENVSLYHDRGTSDAGLISSTQGAIIFNPWYNVTRGTAVGNRIGDEIYPVGMAIRLAYWCAADRQAQYVRIVVCSVPKASTIANAGAEVVTAGGSLDILDPAGSNDTVTGMIQSADDSGIKVLYDKLWTGTAKGKTEDADELGDNRFFKKIWIRAKRGSKIHWRPDGYMKNNPLAVYVLPYDDYGSLRSDILGKCSYTCKLYYKDP